MRLPPINPFVGSAKGTQTALHPSDHPKRDPLLFPSGLAADQAIQADFGQLMIPFAGGLAIHPGCQVVIVNPNQACDL